MSSPSRSDTSVRDAIEDFARHSRKNSEAIDVLVHALKAVHEDLQDEKVRTQVLEARLKDAEAGLARLARIVDAVRRQGWVQ